MHKNRCSFLGKSWFQIMSALSFSLLSLSFLYGEFLLLMTEQWDGWKVVLGEAHWMMLSIKVGACSLKAWLIGSLFLIIYHCLSVKFQQWRSALISQNMPCILCLCGVIHSNPFPFCLEFAFSPCPLVTLLSCFLNSDSGVVFFLRTFLGLLQISLVFSSSTSVFVPCVTNIFALPPAFSNSTWH